MFWVCLVPYEDVQTRLYERGSLRLQSFWPNLSCWNHVKLKYQILTQPAELDTDTYLNDTNGER